MKFTKTVLGLVMANLASIVAAQDRNDFFMHGAVGRSKTSYNTLPQGYTGQAADTTWTIGGGYRLNEVFGIEGAYRDLGSLKITAKTASGLTGGDTGDASAWTAGGFASLPVATNFELSARAGWYSWRMNEVWSYSSGVHGSKTSTGTDPYWGVGAAYILDKQLAVALNWTQFKSPSSNVKDASVMEVGVQYKFGKP